MRTKLDTPRLIALLMRHGHEPEVAATMTAALVHIAASHQRGARGLPAAVEDALEAVLAKLEARG